MSNAIPAPLTFLEASVIADILSADFDFVSLSDIATCAGPGFDLPALIARLVDVSCLYATGAPDMWYVVKSN